MDTLTEAQERLNWITEDRLVGMALNWPAYSDNEHNLSYVWEVIATTQEDAETYYASIDAKQRHTEAIKALQTAGWTPRRIAFRLS